MIKFDRDALEDFKTFLTEGNFSKIFFLVDEITHEKCLIPLLGELESLPETEVLEVNPGEESKSPEVLVQLWKVMAELGADRHSLLVNVGGGMITDLGGFLAGTYMRGIAFVNFPTTVLAQVDASVGGKTGINLDHVKNLIGLFIHAEKVYILNNFLETLSPGERLSGFAEMLKHGLIADTDYWNKLSVYDIKNKIPSQDMIRRSIEIKSQVTEADFKESGYRKILNFGHTLGHAIETTALDEGKPLLHGEAVAIGMIGELLLSVEFAGLDEQKAKQAIEVLRSVYKDAVFRYTLLEQDFTKQLEVARQDKKNRNSEIRFTLLRNIGEAVTDIVVPEEKVLEILKYLNKV